jgi:hypothetical protein
MHGGWKICRYAQHISFTMRRCGRVWKTYH